MPFYQNGITRNLLLQSLDPSDFAFVATYLERVPLNEGAVIVAVGDVMDFVCFPECGVTSIADVMPDGSRIEIGIVGREGMTNAAVLLGCERAPHEATVQIGGGQSLRLDADRLKTLCERSPRARALFLRFVQTFAIQTARTLSSNLRDTMKRRLARWLLMCHDRVDGDELHLIHKHIGRMLGVRRATVTDALHHLEGEGAIRNRRSRILIRDRGLLETLAGGSYGFAEAHYRKLVAPFGPGRDNPRFDRQTVPSGPDNQAEVAEII